MEPKKSPMGQQDRLYFWRQPVRPSASATSGSSPARPTKAAAERTSSSTLLSYSLIGIPVMLSELTIGRGAQANAIDSYGKLGHPGYKWVGWFGVIVAFIITSYYCHVGGWVLRYVASYATEATKVYADPLGYFYALLGYNAVTGETWFPLDCSYLRGYLYGHYLLHHRQGRGIRH